MTDDLLDLTFTLEGVESLAGETAVDLETINEGGDSDQTVRLDILVESLEGGLVEDNSVLGLVLDCTKMSACVAISLELPARSTISFAFRREFGEISSRSHGW